jgi:glycosyltransferase involved in cell wall biosynthesis
MKIAFVYDVIYPYVKGGVEKRVWELAVRLVRHGNEVHIIGMKCWEGEEILIRDGVILHGICPSKKLYAHGRRTIGEAVYFSIHLFFYLTKYHFDIIDCQQFPYLSCISTKIITVIKRTPLVITWHEVWGEYWYTYLGSMGFFGKCTEHVISHLTPHVVAVSGTTAMNLASMGYQKKIRIITNGVDLHRIDEILPHAESTDGIFAGRLIKEKHVDVLLQAWAILAQKESDYTLLVIGEGPELDRIQQCIHALSLDHYVRVIGFRNHHDELITRMKSAKVCVLPSTREGFGITALEALASGLPVVTVDNPANAIRDLITEENGFISTLSPEDLAAKVHMALMHHKDMKKACRETADSFDWDCIATDIEAYYRSITTTPHESLTGT